MLTNKKRAIISLLAIFLCGLALGILVDRTLLPSKGFKPKKDPGQFLMGLFTERLALDETQQNLLKVMMDDFKVRIDSMREDHSKGYWQARELFDSELREILTDEQKTEFDKFLQEAQEKFKKEDRRHGRNKHHTRDDAPQESKAP